jgi:hypothetical protein
MKQESTETAILNGSLKLLTAKQVAGNCSPLCVGLTRGVGVDVVALD